MEHRQTADGMAMVTERQESQKTERADARGPHKRPEAECGVRWCLAHWTDGETEAQRGNVTDSSQATAMQGQANVHLTSTAWAPSSPALGLETFTGCLCSQQGARYLVALRPAVLDQVPHVVELAGVAPAPGVALSDDNQSKYSVALHSRRRQLSSGHPLNET